MVQAAVPHAEVVQRDMDARLPQPLQRLRRVVDGLDENALGDLQGDPVGGHAGRTDQVQQMLRAVPHQQLLDGQVDADAPQTQGVAAGPHEGAGGAQHVVAQLLHQAVALGEMTCPAE